MIKYSCQDIRNDGRIQDMRDYSFKDYAYEVLLEIKKPLGYKEIWDQGKQLGYDRKLDSKGKTP